MCSCVYVHVSIHVHVFGDPVLTLDFLIILYIEIGLQMNPEVTYQLVE